MARAVSPPQEMVPCPIIQRLDGVQTLQSRPPAAKRTGSVGVRYGLIAATYSASERRVRAVGKDSGKEGKASDEHFHNTSDIATISGLTHENFDHIPVTCVMIGIQAVKTVSYFGVVIGAMKNKSGPSLRGLRQA